MNQLVQEPPQMSDMSEIFDATDGAELGVRVRADVQRDPLFVLRTATVIARGRGRPPSAVTRACKEEGDLIAQAPPLAVRQELERALNRIRVAQMHR
ncbi:MAG TPA: hypothetical protein VKB80_02470 [Kofleriaceae bacterium]|nr:hypothetical protein [Kofleriaceae bacterium]